MITISSNNRTWKRANRYLDKLSLKVSNMDIMKKYGERGVEELKKATPQDSGLTADSWTYSIEKSAGRCKLSFYNSNTVDGESVALLLQYGHGTKNGGYVSGIDYINPALKPVFDQLATKMWEELTSL